MKLFQKNTSSEAFPNKIVSNETSNNVTSSISLSYGTSTQNKKNQIHQRNKNQIYFNLWWAVVYRKFTFSDLYKTIDKVDNKFVILLWVLR